MEQQFTIAAGKALQREAIGFLAYGVVVENITNQWYYEPSRRRWIPPYQAGVTVPLIGVQTAELQPSAPGQIVQAAPIVGEYVTISFTSMPIPAGAGINVSGQAGPTSVPVTTLDLAQGGTPATPTVGLTRVWADANGAVHRLLSSGADRILETVIAELSGAAGAYVFSNIPQTSYRHLELIVYARSDAASTILGVRLQCNGDTAAHYYDQRTVAAAAAVTADEALAQTSARVGIMAGASTGASLFGTSRILIPHYAQPTAGVERTMLAQSGVLGALSTGQVQLFNFAAQWDSVAPITQLTLFPAAGSFVAGSRALLVGVPI